MKTNRLRANVPIIYKGSKNMKLLNYIPIKFLLFLLSVLPLSYAVLFIATFSLKFDDQEWMWFYLIHEYATYTLWGTFGVFQLIISKQEGIKQNKKISLSVINHFLS